MDIQVCIDGEDIDRLAEFWTALLGYRAHGAMGNYRSIVPEDGTAGPKIVLQKVPEPKTVKNRVHLDLYLATADELEAEVARAVSLGATAVPGGAVTEGNESWVVMADPEGNEFCLCVH